MHGMRGVSLKAPVKQMTFLLTSAQIKIMFCSSCIILRIKRVKIQMRSFMMPASSGSALFANSTIFMFGALSIKSVV